MYVDARDDGDILKPLNRCVAQANNDFAARLDWAVAESYSDANHHPIIALEPLNDDTVRPGEMVTLNASTTVDPDGDPVSYRWWQYKDAGTFEGLVTLERADTSTVQLQVPAEVGGGTIHLVLEVADEGRPRLVSYRRFILTVKP